MKVKERTHMDHKYKSFEKLVKIRWSGGTACPTVERELTDVNFTGAARKILEIVDLLKSKGAQEPEGKKMPHDSGEYVGHGRVSYESWSEMHSYHNSFGFRITSDGLEPEHFKTIGDRLAKAFAMKPGNYCRPKWIERTDEVAIFEIGGYGIGD